MNELSCTMRITLLLVLVALVFSLFFGYYRNKDSFKVERIAHAGGGINGIRYTNSYEALNLNIRKGFKYFELDFSFTQDEKLVCLHDWTNSFQRSFGFSTNKKVTLQEFLHLVSKKSRFEKCTLDGLSVWMQENPTATIVTDVKEGNYKALQMIVRGIPNGTVRVIPQIYDPHNFEKIKQLGYKQIIWTLYRYQGNNQSVLDWVDKFNSPVAVAMPEQRAITSLPEKLQEKGVPTYVHTVNGISEKDKFLNRFNISEIYTDFLVD